MRILIASALALAVAGSAFAQSGGARRAPPAASGPLQWRAEGRSISYGESEDRVVLKASCDGGPGYDLTLRLPGAYPGPWQDGQSMEISASSGVVPLVNLSGAIEESDDESHWLFRTRVGSNDPLLGRLMGGQSIQINAGRDGYRIDPRDGRAALQSFRESCARRG